MIMVNIIIANDIGTSHMKGSMLVPRSDSLEKDLCDVARNNRTHEFELLIQSHRALAKLDVIHPKYA